jgi:hypothetical protein
MKHLKILSTVLLIFTTLLSSAQGFEGEIEFKRINNYDETGYLYSVSHGKVRIDEYDKDKKIVGTMIVNLKDKSVIAINHERKMYMDVKSKPSTKDLSKCESFKTSEKKEILGYPCTKWIVKNAALKSNAEYWVVDKGNYFFFKELLSALNRKDKIALYFMQIPENAGFFPIVGKEIGLDGKMKAKFQTDRITRKKISSDLYKIPNGYKKFN